MSGMWSAWVPLEARPGSDQDLDGAARNPIYGKLLQAAASRFGALPFQVEIQLLVVVDLPARIRYGWADLYSEQLKNGRDSSEPRPTYSIWLLGETLIPQVLDYAHCLRMCDERGRVLIDCGGIWRKPGQNTVFA
jgi:hypothetical protein